MEATYTQNGTEIALKYGESEPMFMVTIGTNSPIVEEAPEECKAIMRKRFGVVSIDDLDWQNMFVMESLCEIYYRFITGRE